VFPVPAYRFATFSSNSRHVFAILANGSPTFPGDFALLFRIHGSKTPGRTFLALSLILLCHNFLFK
jgi:hypothetical protein